MGTMPEIIIDEEFQFLLPSLDKDTFALLEENILENGIRDPIVLWDNVIIDGHNRYNIAVKHGIVFNTVSMEFNTRDDVIIWIISTQVSRRNLTPIQLSMFRGLHYKADKRSRGYDHRHAQEKAMAQNGPLLGSTANRLAKQYRVSRNTIKRDARVAEALSAIGKKSPVAKRMILSGEVDITRKQLNELLEGPEGKILETAESIENGTYERQRTESSSSGVDRVGSAPVSEIKPLDTMFFGITDSFYVQLRELYKNYDSTAVKAALRSHIDTLEDLYRQM